MTGEEIKHRFVEISKVKDAVKQSELIEDICYDAEILLEQGEKDLAIEVFKKILEIELIEEDLSQNALGIAEERLIELRIIKLEPLKFLEKKFSEQFKYQSKAMKLLSIAKSIWNDWRRKDMKTARFCFDLISESEKIHPLSRRDTILKLELEKLLNK